MNVYTSRANKDLHNSETRKQPVRLGRIQKLILEFASEHLYISASEVSVWAKERGVNVSVKRIHDALKRLMQRNIVEKISHGVYRLTEYGKKLLSILLSCKQVCRRDKETELPSFAGVGDGVRRYVVRLHSRNSRSVEDVIRLHKLWEEVGLVMARVPEEDFIIQDVEVVEEFERAPMFESIRCSKCGELVMAPKVVYVDGRPYCRVCVGREVPAVIGRGISTVSHIPFRVVS